MSDGNKDPLKQRKPHISSTDLIRSYIISMLISAPCLGLTVYLTQFKVEWWYAHGIFAAILVLSFINIMALILLDQAQYDVGRMTIPSLIAVIGLVLFFVILEGLSRFFPWIGYRWLFPVIALALIFKYLAIFKEKNLALKFYLAMNGVALATLWGLGQADKIDLPF